MMKRALLLIDIQNDFCAGGALEVAEGDDVVEVANALIKWCKARGDVVLGSQDWHPANHGSFASQHHVAPFSSGELEGLAQTFWPDHCVLHSFGAELHPQLDQQSIDKVFRKGEDPKIDSYSAFFDNGHRKATGLHAWLQEHGARKLLILGLATDYCVKFSVLDALQLGYQVCVITDGCRGVNIRPEDSEQAFIEMAAKGARLYTFFDWRKAHE